MRLRRSPLQYVLVEILPSHLRFAALEQPNCFRALPRFRNTGRSCAPVSLVQLPAKTRRRSEAITGEKEEVMHRVFRGSCVLREPPANPDWNAIRISRLFLPASRVSDCELQAQKISSHFC